MTVDVLAQRVRAEFEEMPGLALTVPQASKLFGLEAALCQDVIELLIGSSYLRRTRGGVVTRRER